MGEYFDELKAAAARKRQALDAAPQTSEKELAKMKLVEDLLRRPDSFLIMKSIVLENALNFLGYERSRSRELYWKVRSEQERAVEYAAIMGRLRVLDKEVTVHELIENGRLRLPDESSGRWKLTEPVPLDPEFESYFQDGYGGTVFKERGARFYILKDGHWIDDSDFNGYMSREFYDVSSCYWKVDYIPEP